MNEEYFVVSFTNCELDHISDILRGAYEVRTAGGLTDEILADFIDAIDEADVISVKPD